MSDPIRLIYSSFVELSIASGMIKEKETQSTWLANVNFFSLVQKYVGVCALSSLFGWSSSACQQQQVFCGPAGWRISPCQANSEYGFHDACEAARRYKWLLGNRVHSQSNLASIAHNTYMYTQDFLNAELWPVFGQPLSRALRFI